MLGTKKVVATPDVRTLRQQAIEVFSARSVPPSTDREKTLTVLTARNDAVSFLQSLKSLPVMTFELSKWQALLQHDEKVAALLLSESDPSYVDSWQCVNNVHKHSRQALAELRVMDVDALTELALDHGISGVLTGVYPDGCIVRVDSLGIDLSAPSMALVTDLLDLELQMRREKLDSSVLQMEQEMVQLKESLKREQGNPRPESATVRSLRQRVLAMEHAIEYARTSTDPTMLEKLHDLASGKTEADRAVSAGPTQVLEGTIVKKSRLRRWLRALLRIPASAPLALEAGPAQEVESTAKVLSRDLGEQSSSWAQQMSSEQNMVLAPVLNRLQALLSGPADALSVLETENLRRLVSENLSTVVQDFIGTGVLGKDAAAQSHRLFCEQVGLIDAEVSRLRQQAEAAVVRKQAEYASYLKDSFGHSSLRV